MLIVTIDPNAECGGQLKRTRPFPEPETFLLQGAHHAFGVGIAPRVVVAGKRLMNAQNRARFHEGQRSGLAAIITHEGNLFTLSDALRKLPVDCLIKSREPIEARGPQAHMMADHLLGKPVQHNNDIDPAEGLHQNLGHIDAPPLIGTNRPGLGLRVRTLGPEPQIGLHQKTCFSHDSKDSLFVHRQVIDKTKMSPNAPVSPERMLRFKGNHPFQDGLTAQRHSGRLQSGHWNASSLFFKSKVSSPTSLLSFEFSRSRTASRELCSWTSKHLEEF